MMAFRAVPFKGVFRAFGTGNFDDQANRPGSKALRRMARMFREQKDFSLLDGNLDGRLSGLLHHADENVAFQLVEKFLSGIVVIIHALVGPADHRDDDIAVLPNLGVADGRLQFVAMGVNPALKIEGLHGFYGWHYFFLSDSAMGL